MKKVLLGLTILASIGFANSIVIEGFSTPESVTIKDNHIYVSNLGAKLEPTKKDGDGFISKLSKNGNIDDLHFIKGLNAPKGLEVLENTIYVTDIDTLKGFDLKSGKLVFSLLFKNTKFLNDITTKDKNTLFVSSSDANAIFQVNLKNKSYKKLLDFTTANGLSYEDGILYAAELGSSNKTMFDAKGKLYKIDLKNKNKLTLLSSFEGILDGVQKVGDKIYVSDWVNFKNSGVIRVYNLKTKKESVLGTHSIHGAADFIIDKQTNKLYIPQMIAGKLSIVNLDK
jgi:hypothetical protein